MIRAAGGLLWDDSAPSRRIALVHRLRHNDWSLPKGKLHEGESWEEGALREVTEETGCRVRLTGFAGALGYQTPKGEKIVRFWNMALAEGPRMPVDGAEVSEVAWLAPDEACQRLTYALERALVESWMDGAAGRHATL
jgi:ADP-ribose pyrophosphatase YjhB (NUDIX family)